MRRRPRDPENVGVGADGLALPRFVNGTVLESSIMHGPAMNSGA